MKRVLVFLLLLSPYLLSAQDKVDAKINGISIWSDQTTRTVEDFEFVKKSNANWVCFQPFGFLPNDSTGVLFDFKNTWECSSFDGLCKNISIAHELGVKVFVKPHLYVAYKRPEAWAGNLLLDTESKLAAFEKSYSNFVVSLARLCDSMNVELFSVGTELGHFTRNRQPFMADLIDTVRKVYKGKIVYSANFDFYYKFPHWDKVDYIGIDAYFTVDNAKHPRRSKCMSKWRSIAKDLKRFHQQYDVNILFTEFGYTSTDFCGYKPWGGHNSTIENNEAQAVAYKAIFDSFWSEDWFAGGFSWIWGFEDKYGLPENKISFSPQNKPAEKLISEYFASFGQSKASDNNP